MKFLKQYLFTTAVFSVIDITWIGFLMNDFYTKSYGDLARLVDGKFQAAIVPGILVYLVIPFGLVTLAFPNTASRRQALLKAALYGFATYGTYDLTNAAVLRNWSTTATIVDMLWGLTLCTIVTAITWRPSSK
jgi:uncharacterized membrane protein